MLKVGPFSLVPLFSSLLVVAFGVVVDNDDDFSLRSSWSSWRYHRRAAPRRYSVVIYLFHSFAFACFLFCCPLKVLWLLRDG